MRQNHKRGLSMIVEWLHSDLDALRKALSVPGTIMPVPDLNRASQVNYVRPRHCLPCPYKRPA